MIEAVTGNGPIRRSGRQVNPITTGGSTGAVVKVENVAIGNGIAAVPSGNRGVGSQRINPNGRGRGAIPDIAIVNGIVVVTIGTCRGAEKDYPARGSTVYTRKSNVLEGICRTFVDEANSSTGCAGICDRQFLGGACTSGAAVNDKIGPAVDVDGGSSTGTGNTQSGSTGFRTDCDASHEGTSAIGQGQGECFRGAAVRSLEFEDYGTTSPVSEGTQGCCDVQIGSGRTHRIGTSSQRRTGSGRLRSGNR